MRPVLFTLLASCLVGVASCYSLTKEECASADWQAIGEADGAAGYEPQGRIADHAKACARIEVIPDRTLWNQGYKAGLVSYCTPLNGLARGEAGDRYRNVCPPGSADGFLRGYGLGKRAYEIRSRIEDFQRDIKLNEDRIDELRDAMRQSGDEMRRSDIRREIAQLGTEIGWSELSISQAELDLLRIERDMEIFRQTLDRRRPVRGY